MEVETCSHPACSCQVTGGKEYCGDHCSEAHNAGKDMPSWCNCGHPECATRP
jgi:hypothetical protein